MKKILPLSLLALAQFVFAADRGDSDAAFVVSPIKDHIFLLKNNGGNIAVSTGEDGLLVVDNGNTEDAEALAETLKTLSATADDNIAYVINTHWHNDHSGANELLGHSAAIIAHDNVRKYLSSAQSIPLFNLHFEPFEPQGLPSITFPEQVNLHINGDLVSVKYNGVGHSDSDAVVYFRNTNVVHMGDSMVYPMFPFIDIEHGGDALKYVDNVYAVLKEIDEETIVIPGHGQVTDKDGVREFVRMLELTIDEVRVMKDAGMSNQQIQDRGLSDEWDPWNHSLIKEPIWIDEIYRSL